jgi:hypothetical protein
MGLLHEIVESSHYENRQASLASGRLDRVF